jgi:hypothetical protein
MRISDLNTYVKKHLDKGYSQTTINEHLSRWGYTQREIDEAKPHQIFNNSTAPKLLSKLTGHTLSDALKHTYLLIFIITLAHISLAILTKEAEIAIVGAALGSILGILVFATQYFLFGALICLSIHLTTKHLFNKTSNYKKLLTLFLYSGTPYLLVAALEPTNLYHYLNLFGVSVGLLHINLSLLITLTLFLTTTKKERGLTTTEALGQLLTPTLLCTLFILALFFGIAEFRLFNQTFQPF